MTPCLLIRLQWRLFLKEGKTLLTVAYFFFEGWIGGLVVWASRRFETVFQSIWGPLPQRGRKMLVGWLFLA